MALRRSIDESSTFPSQTHRVTYKLDARTLEEDCLRQVLLAALAETDEVRLVHHELEQFYRTQLVAMELAGRLDDVLRSDPLPST
ncbi:hypothetical protein [Sphingomonas rubra]|uniref:Uncharacterized protein n=1 Tax=Sphingomonas rubra TaxID=634430 RepID=A0A1I5T375_9SPHN|nr:hypothetical protein [Sphingomonas rubra]SFP77291.1 hypothetical protein SAMN04488241_1073 [Sphingomonas rubra]